MGSKEKWTNGNGIEKIKRVELNKSYICYERNC